MCIVQDKVVLLVNVQQPNVLLLQRFPAVVYL